MKKCLRQMYVVVFMAFSLLLNCHTSIAAEMMPEKSFEDPTMNKTISDAYIDFSTSIQESGMSVFIPYEVFAEEYKESFEKENEELFYRKMKQKNYAVFCIIQKNISNANAEDEYYGENSNNQRDSIVGSQWYDNIGTSNPSLPWVASYSSYNILGTVQMGDIVYETDGGFAEYTGHIAYVQGCFWDSTFHQYYIRTIEAVLQGVVFGVLEDSRYDFRGDYVYRVTNASPNHLLSSAMFMSYQLGKNWWPKFFGPCDTSVNTNRWYCSELVWAAYYYAGINLNGASIPDNMYMPLQLAGSSQLSLLDVE